MLDDGFTCVASDGRLGGATGLGVHLFSTEFASNLREQCSSQAAESQPSRHDGGEKPFEPEIGLLKLMAYQVSFSDDIRNCEDVFLNDAEAWMLLSCDPGRDQWNTVMVGVDLVDYVALIAHIYRAHS